MTTLTMRTPRADEWKRLGHRPMLGAVIRSISVLEVNRRGDVRHPGMLAEMIVDEVPEHAERLNDDERCNNEQHEDADPTGRWTRRHGSQCITGRADLTASVCQTAGRS